MPNERYKFNLGAFECILIQDAIHNYDDPASLLFYNAPQEQMMQILRQHGIDVELWHQ